MLSAPDILQGLSVNLLIKSFAAAGMHMRQDGNRWARSYDGEYVRGKRYCTRN